MNPSSRFSLHPTRGARARLCRRRPWFMVHVYGTRVGGMHAGAGACIVAGFSATCHSSDTWVLKYVLCLMMSSGCAMVVWVVGAMARAGSCRELASCLRLAGCMRTKQCHAWGCSNSDGRWSVWHVLVESDVAPRILGTTTCGFIADATFQPFV